MNEQFIKHVERKARFQHQFDEAMKNIDEVRNRIMHEDISTFDRNRLIKLVNDLQLRMRNYLGLHISDWP
jgi:hypothetical protein